jgi:hypothetical protein
VFFFIVYLAVFSYYFFAKKEEIDFNKEIIPKKLHNLEISVFYGLINIVFALFIFVQLKYFFGGNIEFLNLGLTYAEYARKGFTELNLAVILALVVIFFANKLVVLNELKTSKVFKILNTIFIVQILLVAYSSFSRLSLYEFAYGFTTLRLWSHAFVIFLALLLSIMLIKIWKDFNESFFVRYGFLSCFLFLLFMNFLNPDLFIIKKNIKRYAEIGKIDCIYVNKLSLDAFYKNTNLSEEICGKNYEGSKIKNYEDWQSMNIPRIKILKSN